MLNIESLENFFKPEVRKQGLDYFADDAVFVSSATDTGVSAVIKASPPVRIHFSAASIADPIFNASCTCSASGKGQLCKHIWATILTVAEKHPDFFDSKTEIVKVDGAQSVAQKKTKSASQSEFQTQLKAKQSDYRKQQYQKQKERVKSTKSSKKPPSSKLSKAGYSTDVESALQYFAKNGFEMPNGIEEQTLRTAKKVLSRVFHPDKGGSHEEILELNRNFDIVLNFLEP
jgi:uncharacterized Zn finger protein